MQTLEQHLQIAISYIESGQYEEGLEKLKTVLKQADDPLTYEIALLYLDWGMSEEAYKLLKHLHSRHPGDSSYALSLSEAAIDLDLEDEAIDSLTDIHPLDANYLSAQVLLADLYQAQGLEEAAEQRLLQALKTSPDEPILSFALAEFYAQIGRVSEAIELYKKVLHTEVLEHENIPLKLAEVLSLRGQFEEALIYYNKGIEKGVTLDGLFGYAVTAMQAGKPQTAITQLEKLKELDPSYSSLYPILADAYEEEGAVTEAIEALTIGVRQDEHNERLKIRLAKALIKAGEPKKAIEQITELLEEDSEHVEALKLLVEIYREENDYEAIIKLFQPMEDLEDPVLTWYYSNALYQDDQLEEAFPIYESVCPYFSEDPDFLKEFGEISWEMGNRTLAITTLEKAVSLTQDQELIEFLERLYEQEDNNF
ncbi:tetratricopeptide repeat protein [Pullulanibacillus sp. KACC 23026]|uniref:tetratricopeptide repeat protein n=1 Tax=Pullulanibacillus sp. KACC 23026 TaxID=3028315 RepID=UPI0023AFB79C|nr:tetratricopeptide repeat protein [Pullulanibacillus sp. KACC 23026]WEG11361.1 tetratricopeptide repeat protein [Pullulanibacillus sp. KACC 23026]